MAGRHQGTTLGWFMDWIVCSIESADVMLEQGVL
jgi:hypothetical protein